MARPARYGVVAGLLALVAGCGGEGPTSPSTPSTPSGPGAGPDGLIAEASLPSGGAGGDTCVVTSLAAEGPGTLYDCIVGQQGPRTITFDVSGTPSLPRNTYVRSHTTLDATGAGEGGVTLRMGPDRRRALILEGPVTNVVIRGLRFEGAADEANPAEYDLLALDGEEGLVSDVLVERCTFVASSDGALDITDSVRDAVVRWNLFYGNPLTMLIRYGTRERLSLHRNVFAANGERNPQIRGDVRTIDFVNNVVYDWSLVPDGYGTEIRNDPDGRVDGNFVANAFLAAHPADGPGFTLYNYPGALTGRLWVTDNWCVPSCEVGSTVGEPLPVPRSGVPWPADELAARLLPGVGAPGRTARDQDVLGRVGAAMEAYR